MGRWLGQKIEVQGEREGRVCFVRVRVLKAPGQGQGQGECVLRCVPEIKEARKMLGCWAAGLMVPVTSVASLGCLAGWLVRRRRAGGGGGGAL